MLLDVTKRLDVWEVRTTRELGSLCVCVASVVVAALPVPPGAGAAVGAARPPQTAKPSCENRLLPEQLRLFRGRAGGKRSVSRMHLSLHCNIFVLANLCCVDPALSVLLTNETMWEFFHLLS